MTIAVEIDMIQWISLLYFITFCFKYTDV